jgi:REP element-mobilizing transposase RayT
VSVRKEIPHYEGIYFITFTCYKWLHLFQQADAYGSVYKWFDVLKSKGHYVVGYVIMPNHVHVLIAFRNTQGQSINTMVGNGKRFMAYEIVSSLITKGQTDTLAELAKGVNVVDKRRNKQHQVFEPSFDWKQCVDERFIVQKLDYIHNNPCNGKWNLVVNPWEYAHSSAGYYINHQQGVYEVTPYSEIFDIDLTVPWVEK